MRDNNMLVLKFFDERRKLIDVHMSASLRPFSMLTLVERALGD